jgi:hypothetical protein
LVQQFTQVSRFGTAVLIALVLSSCQVATDDAVGGGIGGNTSSPGKTQGSSGVEVPLGFAYQLELGRGTVDPADSYFGFTMTTATAPISDRFRTSDAVLVVDVVEVGEPHLNSTDENWWSPPHSEDATLVRPAVGIDVVVKVVGVLKLRARETSFGLRPGAPDLTGAGTPHPALVVPAMPAVGELGSIWVQGGLATVLVTAEQWQKYLDDWGTGPDHHEGLDDPTDESGPIPAEFTMEVGGQPGMHLAEGGRYVVFLRALDVPQLDGSVRQVWTGNYSTPRTQLLVDPITMMFVEQLTGLEVSVDELEAAMMEALEGDPEPSAYRDEEFARLFGSGG